MSQNSLNNTFIGKPLKTVLTSKHQQQPVCAISEIHRGRDQTEALETIRKALSRSTGGSFLVVAIRL